MPIGPLLFSSYKHVHTAPQDLVKKLRYQKKVSCILSIATFGLFPLGGVLINKLKKRIITPYFLPATHHPIPEMKIKGFQFGIETLDKIKLDACEFLLNPASKKWMVYFCGNGSPYQLQYERVYQLAKDLGLNLLCFNYRGVGASDGQPTKAFKLALDGASAIEYLKQMRKVAEEDMIIYGYSLGGGVSALLADYYKKCTWANDRSFGFFAAVIAKRINRLVALLSYLLGYRIDAVSPWRRIPSSQKCYFYHKSDQLIPHQVSLNTDLKSRMTEQERKGLQRVKLYADPLQKTEQGVPDYHGTFFSDHKEDLENVKNALSKLIRAN